MPEQTTPRGRPRLDPGQAVSTAAEWVAEGRRVDMQGLATALGVTRMTLHRHTGGRERLIGEALWHLADRAWTACEAEVDAHQGAYQDAHQGAHQDDRELRCVRVLRAFTARMNDSQALRTLFDAEPALLLRLLSDPDGPIAPRSLAVTARLLERDERDGRLRPVVAREQLAYALVKLAESSLVGDLAAGHPQSATTAVAVQTALIEAGQVPSERS